MKTGLTLLIEALEQKNCVIETDNMTVAKVIFNSPSRTLELNLQDISEAYGGLTFFHLSPEEAVKEILDLYGL